jgi:SNF2 family DNA or RNA helicase
MNLQITKDQFVLDFTFDSSTINKVKDCGFKWSPRTKTWIGPADCITALNMSSTFPELKVPLSDFLPNHSNNYQPSEYLMLHQKEAGFIGLLEPRYGFFDDTGTGKTLTGIELIKQKKVKTLVVCKLSLIVNAWLSDLQKFAPEIKAVNLWALKNKRLPPHDVGIINYEQFRTSYKKLSGYLMVLADESSVLKDGKSLTTKAMISYCDNVPYVYLFSGTPAPNNEMEYWSQMRILDPMLLGRSFYTFRNRFCYSTGFGGYTWKMKGDLREEFLEKIGRKSRVIRKEDVLDLPERTFNVRSVILSKPEMEAYRTMERDMLLELEGRESISANAAVKIMKLREGTSGFFLDTEGHPIKTGTSKLEDLVDLLEEIGNHQVIIWTHFHYEADQITNWLDDHNRGFGRVDGTSHNQKTKDDTVKSFIEGEFQYLISHPASLGHGVTLTNCTYAVYFSLSHSYELAYQSQDRIYRKGQRNACTYYYLVAEHTVDFAILKALEKKGDTVQAVFNYLKRNRG